MPCYTVKTDSVEVQAENLDLVEKAVEAMGFAPRRVGASVYFSTENGTVEIGDGRMELPRSDRKLIDPFKRQYSREMLSSTKSRGWAVKWTNAAKTEGVLIKR